MFLISFYFYFYYLKHENDGFTLYSSVYRIKNSGKKGVGVCQKRKITNLERKEFFQMSYGYDYVRLEFKTNQFKELKLHNLHFSRKLKSKLVCLLRSYILWLFKFV